MRVQHHPPDHPYVAALPRSRRVVPIWDVEALSSTGMRIVHLHFGFETRPLDDLVHWCESLRRHDIRLVHTVHDLDNPHLVDQSRQLALLDVLSERADGLLTLSAGVADAVERRTGRRPLVVPHQHLVPLRRQLRRHRRRRSGLYVHAATCRPNLDLDLLDAVAVHAERWGPMRVHVRSPLTPASRRVVARLSTRPDVAVEIAERLTDRQLWARIRSSQALVLPYRWATHSGLLQVARDLRTPVAASDVGALVEHGAHPIDVADVAGSIDRAVGAAAGVGVLDRLRERWSVVRFHEALYAQVLHPS